MKNDVVVLDIMLDGVHKGQVKYTKPGFPQIIDGKVIESYNYNDWIKFVEEQRPSLKGKPFSVIPTNQKVI